MDIKLTSHTKGALYDRLKSLDYSKVWRVSIKEWKDKRGLSANALQHVFYKEISDHLGWDKIYTEGYCKVLFGVDIILSDIEAGVKLDYMLKKCNFFDMSFNQKIELIKMVNITSIMNTSQHNKYIESIQLAFVDYGLSLESK